MLVAALPLASGLPEAGPFRDDPLTGVREGRGQSENPMTPAVEPGVRAPLASADWLAGADPVLKRALAA